MKIRAFISCKHLPPPLKMVGEAARVATSRELDLLSPSDSGFDQCQKIIAMKSFAGQGNQ
jgi:hypothetical protein